ncbi:MAG: AIPR family protein [Pseudomonadota bacterium]
MDPRLTDALRRFARNEIDLFSTPFGLGEDHDLGSPLSAPPILNPTDPETFKRFAVCLAIHRLDIPAVSYDEAFMDDAGEGFAIDGAAIAVGDEPIFDVETARAAALEAAEAGDPDHPGARALRARLLLVHAIASDELSVGEIDRFGQDAQMLLTREPDAITATSIELGRIAALISAMRDAPRRAQAAFSPRVDLVLAFSGGWSSSPRAQAAIEVRLADLRAALPGAECRLHVWDADDLNAAYERVALSTVGVLRDARLLPLPKGPAMGWIGYAPAASVVDLILGPDGAPDQRLFYDNVRHYLGESAKSNPGAAGLTRSLAAGESQEVVLRHNGVTVVAREAQFDEQEGDLMVREYQIVNGAQTALTLFANQAKLDQAHVPIKIVVTEDERVKDGVVLGANTQSAVDRFDMLARRPELRALQHGFEAIPPGAPEKLWLQRRREEPFRGRVNPQRVLTPRQLMEGFAATVMGAPHRVHDNAPQLLEDVPGKIFQRDHDPMVYLAVGWLIVAGRRWSERREERWADRVGEGRSDAFPARYQFLYALYRLTDPDPDAPDVLRSDRAAARYRRIAEIFSAREGAALTDLAGVIVREAAGAEGLSRDVVRRVGFTDAVKELVNEARTQLYRS